MSGYADHTDPNLVNYPYHHVPLIRATPENFKEYGNFVNDYEAEKVIIAPWPTGKRPLMKDTGLGNGTVEGKFEYKFKDNKLFSKNHAVAGNYITGINFGPMKNVPDHILTREANYHPDGGQVFYPNDGKIEPFILLLALPGDDVKLSDFRAFWFDGSKGAQIKPNIWHQPIYPTTRERTFITKQGQVHACVGVDTITEFGKWLKIDLVNNL